jgi:hypothetical protein
MSDARHLEEVLSFLDRQIATNGAGQHGELAVLAQRCREMLTAEKERAEALRRGERISWESVSGRV